MIAQPSFTIIVPTVYGQMLVNRYDINQTNALFKTGQAVDHGEIALLANILDIIGGNHIVLDIGANFGCYSLALARHVGPGGQVHAFEPQRILFNMLAGSVALNAVTNIFCYNAAVGDRQGRVEIPQFDYNQPLNFGSIEFLSQQTEPLSQSRQSDPSKAEYAPLATVDSLRFDAVSLIKVDVEGMELQALQGSAETIRRCQPMLYVEFIKSDKPALWDYVSGFGYSIHENGLNLLCIPPRLQAVVRITPNPPA